MPITITTFTVTARPKWDDPPEYDWNGQIELKLNTRVLSPKQCVKIQSELVEMLTENAHQLESLSSNSDLVSWTSKTEAEEELIAKVKHRVCDGKPGEGQTIRDLIIEEEQARSWPINGHELELVNKELETFFLDPIEKEELKKDA